MSAQSRDALIANLIATLSSKLEGGQTAHPKAIESILAEAYLYGSAYTDGQSDGEKRKDLLERANILISDVETRHLNLNLALLFAYAGSEEQETFLQIEQSLRAQGLKVPTLQRLTKGALNE